MGAYPPTLRDADFDALNTADQDQIKRRFGGFVRSLHSYLNEMTCLKDIQTVRRRWKARVANDEAFGNFATDTAHWYTFHHGGRNEAQFDIGMFPTHLRVGLGFEFSMKKGGDPTQVQLVYACFTNIIRAERERFTKFVKDNHLEVEWVARDGGPLSVISTADVVSWVLDPPREPHWILIGRLLRRDTDSAVLGDSASLGATMQAVLCGFRPIWERTQMLTRF
jgi:hypothetical protein